MEEVETEKSIRQTKLNNLKENHRRTKKGLRPKPPTEEEDDGPPRRKDPQEEGSKTEGREGEKQKMTNAEKPKKGMCMTRKEKKLRNPKKVTAAGQRTTPSWREPEILPRQKSSQRPTGKPKNKRDRQRRGKKPHKRTTTGKPGRSATRETPEKETPPNQKTQENH